jgi:hypothetical protein
MSIVIYVQSMFNRVFIFYVSILWLVLIYVYILYMFLYISVSYNYIFWTILEIRFYLCPLFLHVSIFVDMYSSLRCLFVVFHKCSIFFCIILYTNDSQKIQQRSHVIFLFFLTLQQFGPHIYSMYIYIYIYIYVYYIYTHIVFPP